MNELSLFTGAGGGIWGSKLLGWRTVGYVERDDYCQRVIRQRIRDGFFDDAPIFSDVRTFNGLPYRGKVDILTAGFPCQPFSVAGKRRGAEDERNCWPDTARIIGEVRPRFALLENVPNLLSSGYFGTVLGDLSTLGYDARWEIVSAAEVGAPHLRKRLWIVAHASSQRKERLSERSRRQVEAASDTERHGEEIPHTNGKRLEGQRDFTLPTGTERPRVSGSCWWISEPAVGRVAHGVAHRRDRLKALGNGQVPRVVQAAWEIMTKDGEHE